MKTDLNYKKSYKKIIKSEIFMTVFFYFASNQSFDKISKMIKKNKNSLVKYAFHYSYILE